MAVPKILAGPIVRRVAGDSVAVWVALSQAETVTLDVWSGPQTSTGPGAVQSGAAPVAHGTAATRAFGAKLHVAVVVAKAQQGSPIVPGTVYGYDITIGADNLRSLGLLEDEQSGSRLPGVDASAPLHLALGYEQDRLPTFTTPAPLIGDLCLAHTSCRRTNADGPDALAYLDDLIRDSRLDVARRPQQLFLTGDQIYADDLGACLLPQINEIGRELVGFTETLAIDNVDVPIDLVNFPALRRRRLVREIARFSTTDGLQHLLSFGEFVAMHLLVWSPRLWRPLAAPDDVFVGSSKVEANHLQDWETKYGSVAKWRAAREKGYVEETQRVAVFRAAVPRVARALANVATYMVFDDHEITDDWYLSRSWRSQVLTAPFGRGVLRNGYAAYTVCQGWGNDPDAFAHAGAQPKPKNEELLDTLASIGAAGSVGTADRDKLEQLLGLTAPLSDPEVRFHYSVPGPKHMVRVLDTRSRRGYKSRLGPPKLVGDLNAQLPAGPMTDGRELLVLISAAPVLFPRLFDTLIQPLAARVHDFLANVTEKAKATEDGPPITGEQEYDLEGWGADEDNLEDMIRRLATYPNAVVLSGDVHFASSVALDFWSGSADQQVDARIVQLTSSAARNGANAVLKSVIRAARFSQQLLRGLPFERLGWSAAAPVTVPSGKAPSAARLTRMRRTPSLLPARGWPGGTTIPADKPPDWRWRLNVLRDETPRAQITHPEHLQPALPAFDAGDPVATYDRIAGVHAQLALSPTELLRLLVFRTNIGVVRFESAPSLTVVHELWSMDAPDSTDGGPFTHHRAPLALTPSPAAPQLVADG